MDKLFEIKKYDVIIMDIVMRVLDGIETTSAIKEKFPETKIIALSMHDEERYVIKMLECGASGYLLKNADKEEIIEAIKIVLKGGIFISKEISISVFQKIPNQSEINSSGSILHDETLREIIFLLCAEMSSKQIGDVLCLSKRTIDKYRDHIAFRIGAKSLAGVIKYGIDHGISGDALLRNKFIKVLPQEN